MTNNDCEGWHSKAGRSNLQFYVLVPLLQREAETVGRQLQPFFSQYGQCIDPFENAQRSITLYIHLVLRFSFTKKLTPRWKISSRSNLCKLSCLFNY
ncbi:hypothetical protein MAR_035561 [Mya arenaria]|uniref:Uncharacterized protein n=1 Tax=Mya arenaria TaxID=6604 RepID=A0ABY7EKV1_MYAAR|nr:hypothetical protein MAR_035561 [Mya arenaria]